MKGERSKRLIEEISAAIGQNDFEAARKLIAELEGLDERWLVETTGEAEAVRLGTLISFLGDDN